MPRPFKRRRIARRRRRSWRRKYLRGKSRFARAVKSVILRTAEKKYRSSNLNCNSAYDQVRKAYPLNHNSIVRAHIVNNVSPDASWEPAAIAQGDSDGNRNGDEIYGKGFMIRGSIDFPYDRANTHVKMYVVEYNSTAGDITTKADLQHNVTGSVMLDPFQADRWKVRCIGSFRPNKESYGQNTQEVLGVGVPYEYGKVQSVLFKKWIPFRRKLCYKEDTSLSIVKGMKEYLSVFFLTYDTQGTIADDTCAYVRMSCTFHYGDP